MIYHVFHVKISLEVRENGRTRCEKNQVSYELVELIQIKNNMREL